MSEVLTTEVVVNQSHVHESVDMPSSWRRPNQSDTAAPLHEYDPSDQISEQVPRESPEFSHARETYLRKVLDGGKQPGEPSDYDEAIKLGIIDEFEYDTDKRFDGIEHVLSGDIATNEDGYPRVGGFHHEPSGAHSSGDRGSSKVDRTHLEGRNSAERRHFSEKLFEPYLARVAIGGLRKVALRKNDKTGELEPGPLNNSMFPKEMDALDVLTAVVIAKRSRDVGQDEIGEDGLTYGYGWVPMLDGSSPMRIKFWLDSSTDKIISAFPLVKTGGKMKLTEDKALELMAAAGIDNSWSRARK